jgi:hypothetical protein
VHATDSELTSSTNQIIKNWENSGNGFGMKPREMEDEDFGHFDETRCPDGDNRQTFIKRSKGHRVHHLYFWNLADELGMLKNVLNVLSAAVAGDTDNVPGDTVLTQKARRVIAPVVEDERERKKQKYRDDVAASLAAIGQGMHDFNSMKDYSLGLHRLTCTNDAIAQVRNCIRLEETNIQKFKLSLLVATTEGEKELFEQLLAHHQSRVEDYTTEELALCHKRNKISAQEQEREDAASGRVRFGKK